jgi:6-phosphogluconolactonase (cycloisomerase 2 family)
VAPAAAAAGATAPLGAIPGAQTIGGSPAPGAPPSAGGGGGGSRSALWVVLSLVLLVGVGVAAYLIGKDNNSSSSSAATTPSTTPGASAGAPAGTVYVESNTAKANGNTVIAMQYGAGGNLSPLRVTEYPTGGAGSTDLTDSGVLDADHHLWYDASKKLLFAVNQGSDTIAVFNVAADGSLTPVQGSPFPSGGMAPASVSVVGDTAIVANKAQDGVRNLETVAPTYATFHVGPTGALTQFGPVISALPKSSPTDVDPAPNGTFVLSTEEGGPFRAFTLGPNGLTQGSNSPLAPDASIFPANFDAAKKWGLGISAHPKMPLEYIGMATVNKVAVYQYDATGKLTFVRAVDAPGAELPCWTLVNAAGTRLYTANAGNDSVNVFDLTDPTNPKPLQNLKLHGDGNPWDMRFDPTEKEIFLITPRARMNVKKGDGQTVHTLLIGADGTLAEPDYSPVTLPVAQTYQPYGMAVAARG